MDAIVYDKVGKEAEKVREALYGIYPQATITDAAIASFDDGADGIPIKALTVGIEPVQAGSGDPSPDNVRPISGWTGASVERTGKNLLDANNYQAGIAVTAGGITTQTADRYSYYISVKEGEIFTFSAADRGTSTYFWICTYATEPNVAGVEAVSYSDNISGTDSTVTIPNGAKYLCLFFGAGVMVDPQLELGSTATDYEPYTGNQVSVTFPETIYGGEHEVVSGKLKKTMGVINLGEIDWSTLTYNGTRYFYFNIFAMVSQTTNVLMSCYSINSDPNKAPQNKRFSVGWDYLGQKAIGIRDDTYPDVLSFKAAMDGQKLVYLINQPIEYSTEPQALNTLYGTNNIWADTGDIKSLTYRADLGKYIDNAITTAVANTLNA